ncbi:MAG: hypothetical protein HYW47_02395 [Deltaproteobacteria bacterium]|nr:hypothetical protein [Deltaproteobacteria bacterium]
MKKVLCLLVLSLFTFSIPYSSERDTTYLAVGLPLETLQNASFESLQEYVTGNNDVSEDLHPYKLKKKDVYKYEIIEVAYKKEKLKALIINVYFTTPAKWGNDLVTHSAYVSLYKDKENKWQAQIKNVEIIGD